jgi:putative ABC transport system substrate-binding protein
VADLSAELGPKHLEILHEMVPTAASMGLLVNPTNTNAEALSGDLQSAARTLALQLHVLHASSETELDNAFTKLTELRSAGLVIGTDAFFNSQTKKLAALTIQHAMPAIHSVPQFAAAGGLMSYGGGLTRAYRQAAINTGRILKGERPAEMPVQQSTKVELIINMKTAKALRITVPITLLGRADEVIE